MAKEKSQDLTSKFWEQLGIPTATLAEARRTIELCFSTGLVPCLIGESGIGKTHLMKQITEDLNWSIVIFFLAHREREDLSGIPFPSEDKLSYRFLCEEAIKNIIMSDKPTLILLDEWNRGEKPILNAAFTLIEDRKFGVHSLPNHVRIAACMNPSGGSYTVTEAERDPAFRRRLCFLAVQVNVSVWAEWALGRGKIHQDVVDFIRIQPQFLNDTATRDAGKIYPNPSSWEKVSTIQKAMQARDLNLSGNGKDERTFRLACSGFIGMAAAETYLVYLKDKATTISPEDVIMRYSRVQKKVLHLIEKGRNDAISELYTAVSLTLFTDEPMPEKCAKHLGAFFGDLPPDMSMAFFRQFDMRSKELDKREYMRELSRELTDIPAYKHAVEMTQNAVMKVAEEAEAAKS